MVKAIPEGYHTVTPYLTVSDPAKLLDFVKAAFGAKEKMRMPGPDGKIAHAEVEIGDSVVMMGSPMSDTYSLMPGMIYLYVKDTDGTYQKALKAGATSLEEPSDQFYGDRRAAVKDATGNHWFIATHVEDPSAEEMGHRMAEMQRQMQTSRA